MFNSVQKFYCEGTIKETWCERIIDEPNTADTWNKYESELPKRDEQGHPHCLLPLHFWLDEGLMTKRVTMHPMVLRAAFLPGKIRNASGNGGGILIGYMVGIPDLGDPTDRKSVETVAFAKFKMKIYQRILSVIFSSLKSKSWNGEPIEWYDNRVRLFHPGFLIESMDGKEEAYFNGCRAALANHPCPKCLVHKDDLHCLTKVFTMRASEATESTICRARNAPTKGEKERILKKHGLHDVDHFLWGFRFSDSHAAAAYDVLHKDDIGKNGSHLWPLVLEILEDISGKGTLAKNMRKFARWPGLKHFNRVTTVHFSDGETFYHIIKILPPNSALVHCLRSYQRLRAMIGMNCMSDSRLYRLATFIKDYEFWCSKVSDQYGKSFDFPKQHATSHIIEDIRTKGTTNHFSTRSGEGFQQEAREAYGQTNFKDVVPQMTRIDENQEAIARIRMAIDEYEKQCTLDEREDDDLEESSNDSAVTSASWRFGSPERKTNSRAFADILKALGHSIGDFYTMLRDFIAETFPGERMTYEQHIQIRPFKCAHITYQSLEDWRGLRDIVRCNPIFHGQRRQDCVLVNSDAPGMSFARLSAMIRCTLESKRQFDVAVVQSFKPSKWRPNTNWTGCHVHEQSKEYSLLLMDYVIRGALLTPARGTKKERLHYLIVTVDADMFLRVDKLEV
ncbi:hypothetical protein R3P38DRAFT_3185238 [Favolaschia claudopus]|uniref:Uncharacterized protein n=1 Tax=Favolaschia claudopus TaxID=2862362 RepID=A0AAW0C788_9AGAR